MTAAEVAADPDLFRGNVRPQWVLRNVRPKVDLGHSTKMFYKQDVRAWIERHRQEGAA